MTSLLKAALVALPLAFGLGSAAQAQIVNIDATQTGCSEFPGNCNGGHAVVGTFIGGLINPTQLTLTAGTYTITNGSGLQGANPDFTAWRFNADNNWVWSFMAIDDADKTLLVQGCCGSSVFDSQAGAANDPFAVNYSSTLVLAQTTTLDFITEDYYPYDNAGGVTLDIEPQTSSTPEPASFALMLTGLVVVGGVVRRGRASPKR